MRKFVIIGEGRILLDEPEEHQSRLSLKICVGTNINKYPNLYRNIQCDRWETPQIKLTYFPELPIELELYYPSKSIPKVVGEAVIESHLVSSAPQEEIKIALSYDGIIKGWFYFLLSQQGIRNSQANHKYLYIHKVNLFFRDDNEKMFTLSIFQNQTLVFSKQFVPIPNSKTLFPNFRNRIRFSDVIKITLTCDHQYFTPISFLVDRIKRGKTAYFESWIRNKYHNKVGDIRLEYFLDNAFINNERKVLSRKPIYPHALSRVSSLISYNAQQLEEEHKKSLANSPQKTRPQTNFSVRETLKDEEEKENDSEEDKQISICENSRGVFRGRSKQLMSTLHRNPKVNDKTIPYMKKTKTLIKVCRKDPSSFYLECPIE